MSLNTGADTGTVKVKTAVDVILPSTTAAKTTCVPFSTPSAIVIVPSAEVEKSIYTRKDFSAPHTIVYCGRNDVI